MGSSFFLFRHHVKKCLFLLGRVYTFVGSFLNYRPTKHGTKKSLSLKVTFAVEFAMSLVGVVTFSSLVTMMLIQTFTTMIKQSVAVGVALVGRMVPNSIL